MKSVSLYQVKVFKDYTLGNKPIIDTLVKAASREEAIEKALEQFEIKPNNKMFYHVRKCINKPK